MTRISLRILAFSAALSTVAYAEDWSGKLIEATRNDQRAQEKTVSCDASSTTTVFAPDVSGKIYKLDTGGNSNAATALKYRADPPSDSSSPPSKEVKARVTGTEAGGMILVETIGLQ